MLSLLPVTPPAAQQKGIDGHVRDFPQRCEYIKLD